MMVMIIHITRKINQINVARQAERQVKYHIFLLYIDRQRFSRATEKSLIFSHSNVKKERWRDGTLRKHLTSLKPSLPIVIGIM